MQSDFIFNHFTPLTFNTLQPFDVDSHSGEYSHIPFIFHHPAPIIHVHESCCSFVPSAGSFSTQVQPARGGAMPAPPAQLGSWLMG